MAHSSMEVAPEIPALVACDHATSLKANNPPAIMAALALPDVMLTEYVSAAADADIGSTDIIAVIPAALLPLNTAATVTQRFHTLLSEKLFACLLGVV
jgi:hypothetical protein